MVVTVKPIELVGFTGGLVAMKGPFEDEPWEPPLIVDEVLEDTTITDHVEFWDDVNDPEPVTLDTLRVVVVIFPNGAVGWVTRLTVDAELGKLVGKDEEDELLDPFPLYALEVLVELPVGAELKGPDENGNEEVTLLVPLLVRAVNELVTLITVEELVGPERLDEMPVPFPDEIAVLVMLAGDVELVELGAEALLTNSDNRVPTGPCRALIPRLAKFLPPQNSSGFPGHRIVHEPCPVVTATSDDSELAQ